MSTERPYPPTSGVPASAKASLVEMQRYSANFIRELSKQPDAPLPDPSIDIRHAGRYRITANASMLPEHRIRVYDAQTKQAKHVFLSDANSEEGIRNIRVEDGVIHFGKPGVTGASYHLDSATLDLEQPPGIGTDICALPHTLTDAGTYVIGFDIKGEVFPRARSDAHPYTSYHLQMSVPNLFPRSTGANGWPAHIVRVPVGKNGQVNAKFRMTVPQSLDYNTSLQAVLVANAERGGDTGSIPNLSYMLGSVLVPIRTFSAESNAELRQRQPFVNHTWRYDPSKSSSMNWRVRATVPQQISFKPARPMSAISDYLNTNKKHCHKLALGRLSQMASITQQNIGALKHAYPGWEEIHAAFYSVSPTAKQALPCAAHSLAMPGSKADPVYLNNVLGSVATAMALDPEYLAENAGGTHSLRWFARSVGLVSHVVPYSTDLSAENGKDADDQFFSVGALGATSTGDCEDSAKDLITTVNAIASSDGSAASKLPFLDTARRIAQAYVPFIATCVVHTKAVTADHGEGEVKDGPVMGHMATVLIPASQLQGAPGSEAAPVPVEMRDRVPLGNEAQLPRLYLEGTGALDCFGMHHTLMGEEQLGIHKNPLTTYQIASKISWALGEHTTLHDTDSTAMAQVVKVCAPVSAIPDNASAEDAKAWYFGDNADGKRTRSKFEFVQGINALQTNYWADQLQHGLNPNVSAGVDYALLNPDGTCGVAFEDFMIGGSLSMSPLLAVTAKDADLACEAAVAVRPIRSLVGSTQSYMGQKRRQREWDTVVDATGLAPLSVEIIEMATDLDAWFTLDQLAEALHARHPGIKPSELNRAWRGVLMMEELLHVQENDGRYYYRINSDMNSSDVRDYKRMGSLRMLDDRDSQTFFTIQKRFLKSSPEKCVKAMQAEADSLIDSMENSNFRVRMLPPVEQKLLNTIDVVMFPLRFDVYDKDVPVIDREELASRENFETVMRGVVMGGKRRLDEDDTYGGDEWDAVAAQIYAYLTHMNTMTFDLLEYYRAVGITDPREKQDMIHALRYAMNQGYVKLDYSNMSVTVHVNPNYFANRQGRVQKQVKVNARAPLDYEPASRYSRLQQHIFKCALGRESFTLDELISGGGIMDHAYNIARDFSILRQERAFLEQRGESELEFKCNPRFLSNNMPYLIESASGLMGAMAMPPVSTDTADFTHDTASNALMRLETLNGATIETSDWESIKDNEVVQVFEKQPGKDLFVGMFKAGSWNAQAGTFQIKHTQLKGDKQIAEAETVDRARAERCFFNRDIVDTAYPDVLRDLYIPYNVYTLSQSEDEQELEDEFNKSAKSRCLVPGIDTDSERFQKFRDQMWEDWKTAATDYCAMTLGLDKLSEDWERVRALCEQIATDAATVLTQRRESRNASDDESDGPVEVEDLETELSTEKQLDRFLEENEDNFIVLCRRFDPNTKDPTSIAPTKQEAEWQWSGANRVKLRKQLNLDATRGEWDPVRGEHINNKLFVHEHVKEDAGWRYLQGSEACRFITATLDLSGPRDARIELRRVSPENQDVKQQFLDENIPSGMRDWVDAVITMNFTTEGQTTEYKEGSREHREAVLKEKQFRVLFTNDNQLFRKVYMITRAVVEDAEQGMQWPEFEDLSETLEVLTKPYSQWDEELWVVGMINDMMKDICYASNGKPRQYYSEWWGVNYTIPEDLARKNLQEQFKRLKQLVRDWHKAPERMPLRRYVDLVMRNATEDLDKDKTTIARMAQGPAYHERVYTARGKYKVVSTSQAPQTLEAFAMLNWSRARADKLATYDLYYDLGPQVAWSMRDTFSEENAIIDAAHEDKPVIINLKAFPNMKTDVTMPMLLDGSKVLSVYVKGDTYVMQIGREASRKAGRRDEEEEDPNKRQRIGSQAIIGAGADEDESKTYITQIIVLRKTVSKTRRMQREQTSSLNEVFSLPEVRTEHPPLPLETSLDHLYYAVPVRDSVKIYKLTASGAEDDLDELSLVFEHQFEPGSEGLPRCAFGQDTRKENPETPQFAVMAKQQQIVLFDLTTKQHSVTGLSAHASLLRGFEITSVSLSVTGPHILVGALLQRPNDLSKVRFAYQKVSAESLRVEVEEGAEDPAKAAESACDIYALPDIQFSSFGELRHTVRDAEYFVLEVYGPTVMGVFQKPLLLPTGKAVMFVNQGDKTYKTTPFVEEPEPQWTFTSTNDIVADFSPDGQRVAVGRRDLLQNLQYLNGRNGGRIARYTVDDSVRVIKYSPDGSLMAVGTNKYAEIRQVYDDGSQISRTDVEYNGYVSNIVWSPDSKYYTYMGKIIEADTGYTVFDLLVDTEEAPVAWSPDGKFIAHPNEVDSGGVWYIQQVSVGVIGSSEQFTDDKKYRVDDANAWSTSVAYSPDGTRIAAAAGNHTVYVWNTQDGSMTRLQGHEGVVTWVAWSPLGTYLASGGGFGDKTVRIWNVDTQTCERILRMDNPVQQVLYSPDGTRLVVVDMKNDAGDRSVEMWDIADIPTPEESDRLLAARLERREQERMFDWDRESVATEIEEESDMSDGEAEDEDEDEPRALIASDDEEDEDEDMDEDEEEPPFRQVPLYDGFESWEQVDDEAMSVVDTATDGRWAVGYDDGKIMYGGPNIFVLPGSMFMVKYSPDRPDSKYLATISNGERVATIWDAATGQRLHTLEVEDEGGIGAIAWSPDSTKLATGGIDGEVHLWDAQTGEHRIRMQERHADAINALVFSPDGARIASGCDNGQVIISDVATGTLRATWDVNYPVLRLEYYGEGFLLMVTHRVIQALGEAERDQAIGDQLRDFYVQASYRNWREEEWREDFYDARVSPNGEYIAVLNNTRIEIWSARELNTMCAISTEEYTVRDICWTKEGAQRLLGVGYRTIGGRNRILLWNILPVLRGINVGSSVIPVGAPPRKTAINGLYSKAKQWGQKMAKHPKVKQAVKDAVKEGREFVKRMARNTYSREGREVIKNGDGMDIEAHKQKLRNSLMTPRTSREREILNLMQNH